MNRWLRFYLLCSIAWLPALTGCGGGGGGSNSNQTITPSAPITITTQSSLPVTLVGATYLTTLTAINVRGAVTWSIAPIFSTTQPTGLAIEPATGVLSGTVNFQGTAGFVATARDASSSTSKSFTLTAYQPLAPATDQNFSFRQYDTATAWLIPNSGVPPLSYTLTGGALPLGVHIDQASGQFRGTILEAGEYHATLTIRDSYSPPETVTQPVKFNVSRAALAVANSLPSRLPINRQFSGKFVATGGTTPYHFELVQGIMPPGLTLQTTGVVSGTPTALGTFQIYLQARDSGSPEQSSTSVFTITVDNARGRNDSIPTATLLGNTVVGASISPYLDPPNTPGAADHDYYKLQALAGSVVHIETRAKQLKPLQPLDTVIELVDGNGNRLTTCNQPGGATANFSSVCLNDDLSATPHLQDSALDFQVPGAANASLTFYLHVFDWSGSARPDMTYALALSGLVNPITIADNGWAIAAVGQSYSRMFSASGGSGVFTWDIASGAPPPGMNLSSSGLFSGTPTTVGDYQFTVRATDSASPPNTASRAAAFSVKTPPRITTTALPNGATGLPYTQQIAATTDGSPVYWSVSITPYPRTSILIPNGVLSGTPVLAGTFLVTIQVGYDALFNISDTRTFNWQVLASPMSAPDKLEYLRVGWAFWTAMAVTGGSRPFTCSIISGSLPPGIVIEPADWGCTLSGTPTAAGNFAAVYRVVDSAQPAQTATAMISLGVDP